MAYVSGFKKVLFFDKKKYSLYWLICQVKKSNFFKKSTPCSGSCVSFKKKYFFDKKCIFFLLLIKNFFYLKKQYSWQCLHKERVPNVFLVCSQKCSLQWLLQCIKCIVNGARPLTFLFFLFFPSQSQPPSLPPLKMWYKFSKVFSIVNF